MFCILYFTAFVVCLVSLWSIFFLCFSWWVFFVNYSFFVNYIWGSWPFCFTCFRCSAFFSLLLFCWPAYFFLLYFTKSFPYENHCDCYKKLTSRSWLVLFTLTYFFLIHIQIKRLCDCCSPQQIRQITVQLYMFKSLF